MQPCDCYTTLVKFYIYCTFSTLCTSIFKQNIQINGQQANLLSIIEKAKILILWLYRRFAMYVSLCFLG